MGRRMARDIKRTEVLSVRIDPKLRYLAELAARQQRRNLSSFTEWAIEHALEQVEIGKHSQSIAFCSSFLWDTDQTDRFVKLAFNFEELLDLDEQHIWKVIRQNRYFWIRVSDDDQRCHEVARNLQGHAPEEDISIWIPDLMKIHEHWALLLAVAKGHEPASQLPSVDVSSSLTPTPSTLKAKKRQQRKD